MSLEEEYISEFSSYGEAQGQLVWPTSIALDPQGNVYVADEWLNRITVFDQDGELLDSWGNTWLRRWGIGPPIGHRHKCVKAACYVLTDSRNHRVQQFYLGWPIPWASSAVSGMGRARFNLPWGIGLGQDGRVFVADWRNDRIQQFTAGGRWQSSFGQSGSGVGQFNRPNSVCVDQDGDIYVLPTASTTGSRCWIHEGRFVTAMLGDHRLSRLGKEKLMANPDMIRQRALGLSPTIPDYEQTLRPPQCGENRPIVGGSACWTRSGAESRSTQRLKEPEVGPSSAWHLPCDLRGRTSYWSTTSWDPASRRPASVCRTKTALFCISAMVPAPQ